VIRRLYDRDHLDQVLATFALILIFSEGDALGVRLVSALSRHSRRRCRARSTCPAGSNIRFTGWR
jgi:branched-subunit amino acid ABC-type transport system permease component